MLSAQKYGKNLHVNYSPFGTTLYGRNWSSEKYRYGFNGMEKDDEVKGSGNSYDFGARMYDSRLGRWLSIDPEYQEYPSYSGYSFSANCPIILNDPTGKWIEVTTTKYYKGKNNELKVKKWYNILKKTDLVKKEIVMHNAKVYNYDQDNKDSKEFSDQLKTNLLKVYNSTYEVEGKKIIRYDEELEMNIYETKKVYQVTFQFANEIEIVEKIADVKMSDAKPDNLFVMISAKTMFGLSKSMGKGDAGGTASSSHLLMTLVQPTYAAHELAHQLGMGHPQMSNTYNGLPADDKDIKNIIQPSNGSYENNKIIKMIKTKESKETKESDGGKK